jgi:hypothetical protein
LKPTERAGFAVENGNNAFKILLGTQSGSASLARVEIDKFAVSFALATDGVGRAAANVAAQVVDSVASYGRVYPGVDLRIISAPDRLKEEIVLESPDAPNAFRFLAKLEGLTASAEPSGHLMLRDSQGNTVAIIPKPFMYDSNPDRPAHSIDVAMTATQTGGALVLDVEADRGWLSDPSRVYPVVIDPTIIIQPNPQEGKDAHLFACWPDANSGYLEFLEIGLDLSCYPPKNMRTLVQFDLSAVPQGATISSADLSVYTYYSLNTDFGVDVHRVTSPWEESAVTWNQRDASVPWITPGGDYASTPVWSSTYHYAGQHGWFDTASTAGTKWVDGVAELRPLGEDRREAEFCGRAGSG